MNFEDLPKQWCESCRDQCPIGCMGMVNKQPAVVKDTANEALACSQKLAELLHTGAPFEEVDPHMRRLYEISGDQTLSYNAFARTLILRSSALNRACGSHAVDMKTGLSFVDEKEEHTPTAEEWSQLKQRKCFKSFVKQLGGLASARRVKCGEGMVFNNQNDAIAMVEANPNLTLKCGWFILVGTPTLFNFNPHWWVEDEKGQAIAVSGETGETHLLLAEPREDFAKLLFSGMTANRNICKSVCRFPFLYSQQSVANFVDTAGQDRHVLRIPVPDRFVHLYSTDVEEKGEE